MAYPIGRGVAPLLVTLGGWTLLTQRPSPLAVGAAMSLYQTAARGHGWPGHGRSRGDSLCRGDGLHDRAVLAR